MVLAKLCVLVKEAILKHRRVAHVSEDESVRELCAINNAACDKGTASNASTINATGTSATITNTTTVTTSAATATPFTISTTPTTPSSTSTTLPVYFDVYDREEEIILERYLISLSTEYRDISEPERRHLLHTLDAGLPHLPLHYALDRGVVGASQLALKISCGGSESSGSNNGNSSCSGGSGPLSVKEASTLPSDSCLPITFTPAAVLKSCKISASDFQCQISITYDANIVSSPLVDGTLM